jgi:hypothetical protein
VERISRAGDMSGQNITKWQFIQEGPIVSDVANAENIKSQLYPQLLYFAIFFASLN